MCVLITFFGFVYLFVCSFSLLYYQPNLLYTKFAATQRDQLYSYFEQHLRKFTFLDYFFENVTSKKYGNNGSKVLLVP